MSASIAAYDTRLFLGIVAVSTPALLLSPTLVRRWERKSGRTIVKRLAVAAILPPTILVATLASLAPFVMHARTSGLGRDLTYAHVPMPLLLDALPYSLVLAAAFGMALTSRAGPSGRFGVAFAFLALTVGAAHIWVMHWSFGAFGAFGRAGCLWPFDFRRIEAAAPIAMAILTGAVVVSALIRVRGKPIRWLAPIASSVSAVVLLWPYRYPKEWRREDIASVEWARIDATGRLLLAVRRRIEPRPALGDFAILSFERLQETLTCLTPRPLFLAPKISGAPSCSHFATFEAQEIATPLEMLFGTLLVSRVRGEHGTGERLARLTLSNLRQIASSGAPPAPLFSAGPGSSYARLDMNGMLSGRLESERRFKYALSRPTRVQSRISSAGREVRVVRAERDDAETDQSAMLFSLNLTSGTFSTTALPPLRDLESASVSPDGCGFVAKAGGRSSLDEFLFVDGKNLVSTIGFLPARDPAMVVWDAEGRPRIVSMRSVGVKGPEQAYLSSYGGGAALVSAYRAGERLFPFYPNDDRWNPAIIEIGPELSGARLVDRAPIQQVLADSVIYLKGRSEVMRYRPETGEKETLFALPPREDH